MLLTCHQCGIEFEKEDKEIPIYVTNPRILRRLSGLFFSI
jgi:hypothetical protein